MPEAMKSFKQKMFGWLARKQLSEQAPALAQRLEDQQRSRQSTREQVQLGTVGERSRPLYRRPRVAEPPQHRAVETYGRCSLQTHKVIIIPGQRARDGKRVPVLAGEMPKLARDL